MLVADTQMSASTRHTFKNFSIAAAKLLIQKNVCNITLIGDAALRKEKLLIQAIRNSYVKVFTRLFGGGLNAKISALWGLRFPHNSSP